jgi:predicted membrane chloride channel (bestrophin family)
MLDKFDPLLLTVLGFLVGLSLSFRSTTAYERYSEGRKYWAQLTLTSQNLGRIIWVHAREREGDEGKKDLLAKMFVVPCTLWTMSLLTMMALALV